MNQVLVGCVAFVVLLVGIVVNANGQRAEIISGYVSRNYDGDTITLEDQNIRLYGIDAPERKQPYGMKAQKFLWSVVKDKKVTCIITSTDRYGRKVGRCFYNRKNDISRMMVEEGLAWAYTDYAKDYVHAEKYARDKRYGLWKQKKPQAPWDYRKK